MVGEKIKSAREVQGLSQIRLAKKASISVSTLRAVEQGAIPSNRTKRALASALDLSLIELGGPNVARWASDLTAAEKATRGMDPESPERKKQRAKEKKFGKALEVINSKLTEKANPEELEILADNDNWFGFQEILWIVLKYGIEIRKI